MNGLRESLLLYAVTDRAWLSAAPAECDTLERQVEEAILGGATIVQLREKDLDDGPFIELARKIAGNAPMTAFAVMHALPRIVEMSPSEGLFAESLMAASASNTPEAQARLRAFLEGRAGKVVKE